MNCNFLIPFSSIQISYTFIYYMYTWKKHTMNVLSTIFIFTTFNFSRNFRNEKQKIKLNTSRFNGNVPGQKLKCIKFKMNLTATILFKNFFKKILFSLNTYICVFPKQLNFPFDLKRNDFYKESSYVPITFPGLYYIPTLRFRAHIWVLPIHGSSWDRNQDQVLRSVFTIRTLFMHSFISLKFFFRWSFFII